MSDDKRFTLEKVDIPFVDIVKLLVKWSLAAIPAMIILTIIFGIIFGVANFLFFYLDNSSVTVQLFMSISGLIILSVIVYNIFFGD